MSNLVLVSGDFCSGSTFLFTLFRKTDEYYCLYEPLHPKLKGYLIRPPPVYEHHFFVKDYFAEYKGFNKVKALFNPDWAHKGLWMTREDEGDDLYRYLSYLIGSAFGRRSKVLLKFNRMTFRLDWLRARFPQAKIVHIFRDKKAEWNSIVKRMQQWFGREDVGQANVNFNHFDLAFWCEDLKGQFPQLDARNSSTGYERFCKLWELSLAAHRRHADISIDYADLTHDFEATCKRLFDAVGCCADVATLKPLVIPPERQKSLSTQRNRHSWYERLIIGHEAAAGMNALGYSKSVIPSDTSRESSFSSGIRQLPRENRIMNDTGQKRGAVVAPASWAVISGGASGLGLAIAKELRHDCHLLLIDSDAPGLANCQQDLAGGGHRIEVVVGDVSHPETWVRARACLEGAVPHWLVQCAGIAVMGRTAETPIDHWRKALEVNFLGLVLGCQAFAADMARLGMSHIVHIASLAAFAAVPTYGPDAASKAAVIAMTETLHNEIGDRVTVTVVCPSYFRSKLADRMVAQNEIERLGLERMISASSRSADDLAAAIIRAARRGDLYFFPPGEDRAFWRLKRLMPVRTLRLVRDNFESMLR